MRSSLLRASVASVALAIIPSEIFLANAFMSHSSLVSSITSSSRHFTTHASIIKNEACNTKLYSTINAETISSNGASSPSMQLVEQFLSQYEASLEEGQQWANEFGFAEKEEQSAEGSFYSIFRAIRGMDSKIGVGLEDCDKLLGLKGTPFYIPVALLAKAESASISDSSNSGTNMFSNFFHFPHLATALEEDFLDAQRGSTDNRKGWQVSEVSQPTGSSFDDARMTLSQVKTALEVSYLLLHLDAMK
mmetsp:Transcript_5107/g.11610  ORF Transcript_5107/g.11610 Transcript_5107/m.11610 type:complete len:248 (+) Transcript_5107:172-915(+)